MKCASHLTVVIQSCGQTFGCTTLGLNFQFTLTNQKEKQIRKKYASEHSKWAANALGKALDLYSHGLGLDTRRVPQCGAERPTL